MLQLLEENGIEFAWFFFTVGNKLILLHDFIILFVNKTISGTGYENVLFRTAVNKTKSNFEIK
jgi:hypothetical protein